MTRRRVVFPLDGLIRSGGSRMLVALANGLAARGHDVTVWTPDYEAQAPWPLDPSVAHRVVPTGRGRGRRLRYMASLVRRALHDADVAYATGYRTPWTAALARAVARSGTRLVYFVQGHDAVAATAHAGPLLRPALRAVGTLGYRVPGEAVCVSRWVAERVGRPDADIVPNGVDLGVFRPRPAAIEAHGRVVVGAVGSAAPVKGFATFADALASLTPAVRARVHVRVAGAPDLALPAGVSADAVAPADDSALATFYSECDIFVFPSLAEGFGLPGLEAMACGAPLLASRCGGIDEYATPHNAELVPPGDTAALASALARLVGDPGRRAELRAAGLATAARFPIERAVTGHAAVVERAESRAVARGG